MTYNKTSQTQDKIVFEREPQTFSTVMKIFGLIGTGLWVVLNIIIGVNLVTTFFLIGLMVYMMWVIYSDYSDEKVVPKYHIINLSSNLIQIVMEDGTWGNIPFEDIERLELEIEHRSPIWANSVGVNYIHYHVAVVRKNMCVWTITSSTRENESKEILTLLSQLIPLSLEPAEFKIKLPNSVTVTGVDPIEIRWSSYQMLSIYSSKLVFENRKSEIKREFALSDFKRVGYSLLDSQEAISVIMFYFKDGDSGELLFKMNTKMSPVGCLQLERWLGQTIQKKLSA